MTSKHWFLYLLECANGSYYAGITTDVEARFEAHQSGKGARYTRARRPVELIHAEPAADRSAASRREAALKKLPRAAKLALAGQT